MRALGALLLTFALAQSAPAADPVARGLAARAPTIAAMRQGNPFDAIKAKLAAGQNAVLQVFGDSTTIIGDLPSGTVYGTTERRYIGRWLDQLGTRLDAASPTPGTGIRIHRWYPSSGTYSATYDEATRASTNGLYLDVYLGSITGTEPRYMLGANFLNALAFIPADGMVMAHGINMNTYPAVAVKGIYYAAIEQYRLVHPNTPIAMITQHPNRDTTAYDQARNIQLANAAALGVLSIDEPWQAFIAAGKPSGWYNSDGIHESMGLGCVPYIAALNKWWDAALPVPPRQRISRLSPNPIAQVLVNGGFSTWSNTATAPDGWTVGGTATFSKDTTNYPDQRQPYTVRMVATGTTQAYIRYGVGGTMVPRLAGRHIWFTALIRKDAAAGVNVGRISINYNSTSAGNVQVVNTGVGTQQAGWVWTLVDADIPADMQSIEVRIYADTSIPPDTTNGINIDQASLTVGDTMASFR